MKIAAGLLLPCFLCAQEAAFPEKASSPWAPAWELTLRGDRIDWLGPGAHQEQRGSARLRLRWEWESGAWSGALGSWAAVGTDSNDRNQDWYDHQPSNGARLDAAWIQFAARGPSGFFELKAGHQENPLLAQESFWDRDLRLTGASLRLAWRSEHVPELGLRLAGGRVRTLIDGDVALAAAQLVARLETGPLAWTAHAGRWSLRWDASAHRERPLGYVYYGNERQKLDLDVAGLGVAWHGLLPVELKGVVHRDPDSRQDGAEFQAWIGSRSRRWWPQVGYVWQRFEARGTLPPVNGDDWWFVADARGPRWEAALALPGRWLLVATYVRHARYAAYTYPVDRRLLQAIKRF